MYRIAIVDDDYMVRESTKAVIERNFKEENFQVECFSTFSQLQSELPQELFTVYILDIELPDGNGLELAKEIRKIQERAYIVFLTAYEKYALSGYEVRAFHYIIKENMEKKEKQIKSVVTRLVVCVSILVMLLLFAAAPVFHKVFSLSSENYEPFVQGLRITAISLLFYGLNRLSITIMNGKGQHQEASIIIYGEAIIYTPFFLFVLPKLFLVTGIWIEPVAAAVLTEAVCVIGQLRKSEKYEYTKAG